MTKEVRPKGEVRLVVCGRTPDGRVLPVDDDSWDAGITEEEADRAMHVSGSYVAERTKVRAAFGDSP